MCTFNIERFLKVLCSVWLTEVFFLFFLHSVPQKPYKARKGSPVYWKCSRAHIMNHFFLECKMYYSLECIRRYSYLEATFWNVKSCLCFGGGGWLNLMSNIVIDVWFQCFNSLSTLARINYLVEKHENGQIYRILPQKTLSNAFFLFCFCKFQEQFLLYHLHTCKCVLESVLTDSLQGPCCNYTTHRLGRGTLTPLLPTSCFACKLKVLPTVAFMTPKSLKLEAVSKQRVRFLLCTT